MSRTRDKRKFKLILTENTPENTPENKARLRRMGFRSYKLSRQAAAPSSSLSKKFFALKKRKMRADDRVYRPRAVNASSHLRADVLAMRCDRSTTISDNQKPVVTSFLVDSVVIENATVTTPRTLNSNLSAAAKQSDSYRPIKRVLQFNGLGSPVKIRVASPNKKNSHYTLTRDAKIGPLSLFSNRQQLSSPEKKIVTKLDAQSEFYQSEQYKNIVKHFAAIKKQKITITEKLLSQTCRENMLSSGRNQNEVMSGKAGEYAAATNLFVKDLKWEWLHLVAHQIAGNESQHPNNLVAGTYHANTLMIFVERELNQLAKRYPQGFTLEIKAHLMSKEDQGVATGEHLQIGTQLEYRIITPDFNILFPFNVQNPNQPHLDYKHYVHALFTAITENVPEASCSSTSDTTSVSHCFKRK